MASAAEWQLPGTAANASEFSYYTFSDFSDCDPPEARRNFPISHCLAQVAGDTCKVGISAMLLAIVVGCNAFKVMTLALTALGLRFRPIVTLGDAVASFLDRQEMLTEGFCMLTQAEARTWSNGSALTPGQSRKQPERWKPRAWRGFHAASGWRWFFCSLLFLAFWGLALGLLFSGISTLRGDGIPTTFFQMRAFGLGKPIIQQMISLTKTSSTTLSLISLSADVLVANTPQLLISLLYLLYNDLFTRMLVSQEWTSYSQTRKPLRVSRPTGQQRSTRFLQLPFRYSIPLLVAMVVLHWLVSQSIFLTLINMYDYNTVGAPTDEGLSISGLGWSPYGIILSLIVGGVIIVVLWLCAVLLRYPKGMLLAGSNSLAISAACHPLRDDEAAAEKPLMWGVVSRDGRTGIGHASFSSGEVEQLVLGMLYR